MAKKSAGNMSDAAFEKLVADTQEAYEGASSDRNWKPDPGKYLCALKELRKGTYQDKTSKANCFFLVPVWTIQEGPLAGEDFEGGFFSNADAKALGRMKGFLESVTGQGGTPLPQALAEATALCGQILAYVESYRSKKDSKLYCQLVEVLASETVESAGN